MAKLSKEEKSVVKQTLLDALKKEKAFWSYAPESVNIDSISDEMLIAYTLRHLDLDDIKLLYDIYSTKVIKKAWKDLLVPEGDYLYTLNRFLAWYYFDIKKPDAYLKSLQTRHFNKLLSYEGSH